MAYDGSIVFETKMDTEGFQKGANKLGSIVSGLGVFKLLEKGFEMVASSMDRAFSRIDTGEQFSRVMTTMTGSVDVTNEALERTNEIVNGTAYGLDVASKSVQNFVSRGMEVSKSTETIEAWGNAVAFYGDGTNATFASVTEALSKMQTKGTVTMEHMEMLLNAGIPAIEMYADALGITASEVTDLMGKGQLKSAEFIETLNSAMESGTSKFPALTNAAKEAGASWSGTFDNMRAAITRGTQAIITAIDETNKSMGRPTLRQGIAGFGKAFEKVLKGLVPLVEFLTRNIDLIAPAVMTAVAATLAYNVATKKVAISTDAVVPILKAVKFQFGEASAAVSLLATGETAAAVASTGLTVGQAALAAITGLLTGKIGIATAAQLVWNAAMAANPVGAIITLVAVLVAGLVALLAVFSRLNPAYAEQADEVKNLCDAQEDLTAATKESGLAHAKNIFDINAEAKASAALTDQITELSGKENKSANDKARLSALVAQLNKSQSGLNLSYDEENDLLSMNAAAIKNYIENKEKIAKVNALIERQNELYKEEAELQENLALVQDNRFETHYAGAAAGLIVDGYFFTQAVNETEAVEEAAQCVEWAKGKAIRRTYLDIETANNGLGRADGNSKTTWTAVALAFCAACKAAGYEAGVYANLGYMTSKLDADALRDAGCLLWLAHYTDAAHPEYREQYDMWQYTSTGKVDGIAGGVDLNRLYAVEGEPGVSDEPVEPQEPTGSVQPVDNVTRVVGPMSDGDYVAIKRKAVELAVHVDEPGGGVLTIGPMSPGDRAAIEALAAQLGNIGVEVVEEEPDKPTEPERPGAPTDAEMLAALKAEVERLTAAMEASTTQIAQLEAELAESRAGLAKYKAVADAIRAEITRLD